jgi:hypothetical protein
MNILPNIKTMTDFMSKGITGGTLQQILVFISVMTSLYVTYKIGMSKSQTNISEEIKKGFKEFRVEIDSKLQVLADAIEIGADKVKKMASYRSELTLILTSTIPEIKNPKVREYITIKIEDIIDFHDKVQEYEKIEPSQFKFFSELLSGKSGEYHTKAIDMVGNKWAKEFAIQHASRILEFREKLYDIYHDEPNSKHHRLFLTFKWFITSTIMGACNIDYKERVQNDKRD